MIQVTPGWLGRLVRHLRDNGELGLVGAVTNAIGNEAAIDIKYRDGVEMVSASRRYGATHFRSLMPVQNVAFFAVAFRRETWERVGELDERFGLGFFEDDDYCRRVSESGLKIAVAEDVFVHHELSASFDLLGANRKKAAVRAQPQAVRGEVGGVDSAQVPERVQMRERSGQGRHRR